MPRPVDGADGAHWADRRLLRVLGSVLVTAALLIGVAVKLDLRLVLDELASMHPGYLLAAAALGPLQVVLSAERWRVVSGALDRPLGRALAIREFGLANLLNQLLPGGVPGDVVRAWRTSDPGSSASGRRGALLGSVRAVVVDRLLGLAANAVVVALGLVVWARVHAVSPPPGAALITALLLAGLALIGLAPASLWAVGAVGSDLRAVLRARTPAVVGLSAVLTATFLLGFLGCAEAVGASLGWGAVTAVPLVLLAMSVPLGFGGLGLREATAALLLPRLGIPAESAVALSAAYGLSATIGALPGALGPLWMR
jgi:uncharacterized membrane protein YbhN (UPF0104 family)